MSEIQLQVSGDVKKRKVVKQGNQDSMIVYQETLDAEDTLLIGTRGQLSGLMTAVNRIVVTYASSNPSSV